MLKDKYTFKLHQHEVLELDHALSGMFERFGKPKQPEVMLTMSVLTKVKGRLHSKLFMPKKITGLSFDTSEALSFYLAYKGKLIDFNPTTGRIFTEFDKTIR